MKITVIGAAGGEVTGSAYIVETQKARVLVDAGMFQGSKRAEEKNRLPIETRPDRLHSRFGSWVKGGAAFGKVVCFSLPV